MCREPHNLDASIDPSKPKVNGAGQPWTDLTRVTIDEVVQSLQAQVTEANVGLTVGYDYAMRSFTLSLLIPQTS